jgi:Mrp family chromosome partitioning ATPase
MPSRPQAFKKSDTARLIRSAREAGLTIVGLVLEGGRVIVKVGEPQPDGGDQQQPNEWDRDYGTETTKVRPSTSKPGR